MEKLRSKKAAGVWTALLVAALSVTACSPGQAAGPRTYQYAKDGYLGTTSANPNLALNPGYHTYQTDSDIVHHQMKKLPYVSDVHVRLDGPIGYVKLRLPPGMPPDMAAGIRAQAEQDLHTSLPRYRFIVIIMR
ncbi:hypothetical protein [Paenibacillus lutrae]|uniref:Sporulation protein n=1 Tax=Paenibacillus lutrae TaxID=2078573 RepID=A0A7X3FMT9_9BACL|nr:hypothetical protein [Paenibacillus lutrae]MVP02523.1 hypothetical protein [Paenibacillus lutrae]